MHLKLQNRTPSLLHLWIFFISSFGADFVFALYQIISAMCCSKFFLSLARSHRRLIWKYAILCGLWNKNCLRRLFLQPPIGYFFSTFLFFVLSLKRRLILLFVSVFSLYIICLFQCSAVFTLVRFSVHQFFFFAFPRIRHSGFGRFHQSSDALVGGIVGIRLTPSFVITFFLGNSFFSMTQRKTISLSLLAANVAG